MKTLHLIRHAKSSWKDDLLDDMARPLSKRGILSCEVMAQKISDSGCRFEQIYSSPAVRAQMTIDHMGKCFTQPLHYKIDHKLYTFSGQLLLNWVRELDTLTTEPVIIGHNPAIADLCQLMGLGGIERVPTCAYIQLHYEKEFWGDLSRNDLKLGCFLTPSMFR